jgi:hypothetical protein
VEVKKCEAKKLSLVNNVQRLFERSGFGFLLFFFFSFLKLTSIILLLYVLFGLFVHVTLQLTLILE